MRILLLVIIFFSGVVLNAQNYNVILIPDSLKEHANVVERLDETHIIIKDVNKAIIKHKYAITILNEAGRKFAAYTNGYSNLIELHDIDGNLYDAFGKKLKNVKKKDIGDYSYDDQMSLATDARFKAHNFYYTQYPYTIEYEDEEEYNGIFYLPEWRTQPYENFAVQSSKLIVETPTDYNLRYKQVNYNGNAVTLNNDNKVIYTWEIKNKKAIDLQPYSPGLNEVTTNVILAPEKFSIQGFTGNMQTWQNFGMFRQTLLGGRDELDDVTKKAVHDLTDTVKNVKDKVRLLYKYMQNNTRYVNISFGIGGWQPFDAKYVAQKKYGDCKALSNFMGALLKETGINSYYTIIKAGENNTDFFTDFSCNQFNHVIRCVPLPANDTMWLECTDQTLPAGYLGGFTCNRPALLITENGGKLVRTPCYTEKDNIYTRNIDALINEKGDLSATVVTDYTGLEYDNIHQLFHQLNKEDIKKFLNREFDVSNYEVNDFSYKETDSRLPDIQENISINAEGYAHVSGKRLFLNPNILSHNPIKLDTSEKRNYDIVYSYSFRHLDTIQIMLPQGYSIESLPKNKIIKNRFGKYECTYIINENKIVYTRMYERVQGRSPSSDYDEFVKFYNDMYKADRSQIVLVKKEN